MGADLGTAQTRLVTRVRAGYQPEAISAATTAKKIASPIVIAQSGLAVECLVCGMSPD